MCLDRKQRLIFTLGEILSDGRYSRLFKAIDKRQGREVVLIGHQGHPEVEGTMGQFDETQGGRRPYRVRLGNPSLEVDGEDLVLTFELPKGSYATEVLHELLKDG